MSKISIAAIVVASAGFYPVAAKDLLFPALSGRVVDTANEIPAVQEQQLEREFAQHEKQTGQQIVVVTLPDLQGRDIETYGYQLGRKWGIGLKGLNNGLLLIHAVGDRKVRIEVGYGLEGVMTDLQSSQIIRTAIIPQFKLGHFADGLIDGAHAIMTVTSDAGAYRPASHSPKPPKPLTLSGVILSTLLAGSPVVLTIYLMVLYSRRKERKREKAEAERAAASALRARDRQLAADAKATRVAAARDAKLAAMSPAALSAFLDAEAAERRERSQRDEEERILRDQRRRQEDDDRRASERASSTYSASGYDYGSSSSSSSGSDSFSGGGGDFGGGGASGSY